MIQDKVCYIRRSGKPWESSRTHHQRALESYLSIEGEPGMEEERISVPHTEGGLFVAYFSKINNDVYQYRDEYGNLVSIMMATPSIVAYINRITDC